MLFIKVKKKSYAYTYNTFNYYKNLIKIIQ